MKEKYHVKERHDKQSERVMDAIFSGLTVGERKAMFLRLDSNFGVGDVAELLDISERAVRRRVSLGMRKLFRNCVEALVQHDNDAANWGTLDALDKSLSLVLDGFTAPCNGNLKRNVLDASDTLLKEFALAAESGEHARLTEVISAFETALADLFVAATGWKMAPALIARLASRAESALQQLYGVLRACFRVEIPARESYLEHLIDTKSRVPTRVGALTKCAVLLPFELKVG